MVFQIKLRNRRTNSRTSMKMRRKEGKKVILLYYKFLKWSQYNFEKMWMTVAVNRRMVLCHLNWVGLQYQIKLNENCLLILLETFWVLKYFIDNSFNTKVVKKVVKIERCIYVVNTSWAYRKQRINFQGINMTAVCVWSIVTGLLRWRREQLRPRYIILCQVM